MRSSDYVGGREKRYGNGRNALFVHREDGVVGVEEEGLAVGGGGDGEKRRPGFGRLGENRLGNGALLHVLKVVRDLASDEEGVVDPAHAHGSLFGRNVIGQVEGISQNRVDQRLLPNADAELAAILVQSHALTLLCVVQKHFGTQVVNIRALLLREAKAGVHRHPTAFDTTEYSGSDRQAFPPQKTCIRSSFRRRVAPVKRAPPHLSNHANS